MKYLRKLLSLLLALTMVLGMVNLSAFADDEELVPAPSESQSESPAPSKSQDQAPASTAVTESPAPTESPAEAMPLAETGDDIVVETFDALTEAIAAATGPTTIKLTQSFDLTADVVIESGQDITLTSELDNGAVLSRTESNPDAFVSVYGTLTLNNIVLDGKGILSNNPLVIPWEKGKVTMNKGTIIRNGNFTGRYSGAGVSIVGELVMNDGSAITENANAASGGGVGNSGTFTMNGGEISGNTANGHGGGVFNTNAGTFEVNGGTISQNNATSKTSGGGGVYNAGTFRTSGGTISGNDAYDGGGVFSTVGINMKDTVISGNHGGGVSISRSTASTEVVSSAGNFCLENVTITGNDGANYHNRSALLIASYANWTIKDCTISDNESPVIYSTVEFSTYRAPENTAKNSTRTITGCTISNNKCGEQSSTSAALKLSCAYGTTTITNSTITGNTGYHGGLYHNGSNYGITILGKGTRIMNNTGTGGAGGIYTYVVYGSNPDNDKNNISCLKVDGAVITGNKGVTAGGVHINGGAESAQNKSLEFKSGAIYGNIGENGCNDIVANYTEQWGGGTHSLIAASKMTDPQDPEKSFADYIWTGAPKGKEDQLLVNEGAVKLTATKKEVERTYAIVNGESINSLDALYGAFASPNAETINIVLGNDNQVKDLSITKPFNVGASHTVTFDGQSVLTDGDLFTLGENVTLTLQGNATLDGKIVVNGNELVMNGDFTAGKTNGLTVDVQNGSFTANGTVDGLTVKLAEGQKITAGENFKVQNGMTVVLDEKTISAFNDAADVEELKDVILIEGCADAALASEVTVSPAINNTLVRVTVNNGNIVLHKKTLSTGAVYLNGETGDDNNNDGLSYATPVKTLDEAREIAAEQKTATIYVTGKLSLSGVVDGNGVILTRHPNYKGHLVEATSDLTLTNITLDGNADFGVRDGMSLLLVDSGTTTLGKGVVLRNNDVSEQSEYPWYYGGGVYVGNGDKLVMNDGVIENCAGFYGGGVLANGTFEMNGGTIQHNRAVRTALFGSDGEVIGGQYGCGGGVAIITESGKMTMNGGTISGNTAEQSGGGIALPVKMPSGGNGHLEVYGGTIDSNHAETCGGGIFVQCGNEAVIGHEKKSESKVYITKNTANGIDEFQISEDTVKVIDVQFAGGGIYVNGEVSTSNNGSAQFYRVVVTNNSAGKEGYGLAGCGTSDTKIYLTNGGAFYDNKDGADVFTNDFGHIGETRNPSVKISPIMLGGGAYNWKDSSGNSVPWAGLSGHKQLNMYSASTQEAKKAAYAEANVFITGNYGGKHGGGIGSNGDVIIGTADKDDNTEETDYSLTVHKEWNGVPEAEKKPVTIQLLVKVGDVYSGVGTVELNAGNKWTATFTKLPKVAMDQIQSGDAQVKELTKGYAAGYSEFEQISNTESSVTVTNYPAYSVTYTWTGLPENHGQTLPTEPDHKAGDKVNVNTAYTNGKQITVGGRTYVFSGWSTSDTSVSGGEFTMPAKDVTITGVWTRTTSIPDPDVPTTDIPEEGPPLANVDDKLNTTDHFAYIIGYPEGDVRPEANMTRAEAVTVFFRLLKDEYRAENWSKENGYPDVEASDWFNNAISTATKAGIFKGDSEGTARPDDPITRAEFAALAARFISDQITDDGTGDFADTVGHWAAHEIRLAAKAGWITGVGGNKFEPDRNITRAEVMTLVNRMLDRIPDKDHMLPDMIKWPDNMDTSAWYYEAVQEATNDHDYEPIEGTLTEQWTKMMEPRDWEALEKEWSTAESGK